MTRLLAVLLILALTLSGCAFRDLDKRFFVVAMGVDMSRKIPAGYAVSVKLAIPAPKIAPQTDQYLVVTEDASTINQAVRLIESKTDKDLEFSQMRVILFGKDVASSDVTKPLDWFLRRRDIQMIANMAVGNPDAVSVLKMSPPSERLPGNSLNLIFSEDGPNSSYVLPETLSDFNRRLQEKGLDPYLPIIEPAKDVYVARKVALLDKMRIKTILGAEEGRLLRPLVRETQKFEIRVNREQMMFAINVDTIRFTHRVREKQPESLNVDCSVKITGSIEEANMNMFDIPWSRLEQLASRQTEEQYVNLLEKIRDAGVDPAGFGLRYRAQRFEEDREWERWKRLYPRAEFQPHVDIKINGTGLLK